MSWPSPVWLERPCTAVMGDDAIAVVEEEQHLRVQSSDDSGQPWLNTIG